MFCEGCATKTSKAWWSLGFEEKSNTRDDMIRVLIQACLLTTILHFTFANEKIVITGNDTMQFSTPGVFRTRRQKSRIGIQKRRQITQDRHGSQLGDSEGGGFRAQLWREGFASWWQCDQCASRVGYGGGPGAHKTFGTG